MPLPALLAAPAVAIVGGVVARAAVGAAVRGVGSALSAAQQKRHENKQTQSQPGY
jgi:hypothetical protein